ncbi:hypothetical protein NDU88_001698 [Pleurodeles waltl]|uniref:Uncharacterized protein n=1 Tax=Pleurodeles waltl TaxID=8319 RepID=A0AAV7MKH9_PLEWA|nr:hypothetical protein NDU88_001698 [Pleurodeles waltl]
MRRAKGTPEEITKNQRSRKWRETPTKLKETCNKACEGDARRKSETHRKQAEEADTFENIRDMDQKCEEDPKRSRPAEKLRSPQFQDPEARHV